VAERSNGKPPRKIIGIYLGWRGQSLNWPLGLDNITFWDRKATALRVAQGSARELLARLRGFQRYYNKKEGNCLPDPENPSLRPDCKIRMLLIGHSFGGWILYSATSGWLIHEEAQRYNWTAGGIRRSVSDRPGEKAGSSCRGWLIPAWRRGWRRGQAPGRNGLLWTDFLIEGSILPDRAFCSSSHSLSAMLQQGTINPLGEIDEFIIQR
jgi:hypothetical protein